MINDQDKTREQLLAELQALRHERDSLAALHKQDNAEVKMTDKAVMISEPQENAFLSGITARMTNGTDISDLRRSENELHDSEEKFREMADLLPQIIFESDVNGNLTYVNKQAFKIFGFADDEQVIGLNTLNFYSPEDKIRAIENIQNRATGKLLAESSQYKMIRRDGSVFNALVYSNPVIKGGQPIGLRGIIVDISERTQLEDAQNFLLHCGNTGKDENFFESLAKYLAQSLNMDYVCIDRLEGDGLSAQTVAIYNDGHFDTNITYTLKETPCGDVVGKTICCFPRDVCQLFPNDAALQDLKAVSYVGTTLWGFDGKPIGLIAIIGRNPLINPGLAESLLKLVAVRAAGEMERMEREKELRESEHRYRMLVQTANEGILVAQDGMLKFINPIISEITDYSLEELLSLEFSEFVHPDDRDLIKANYLKRMKGEPVMARYPIRILQKDASIKWVEMNGVKIEWEGRPATLNFVTDITDRRQADEELKQKNEKLSVLNAEKDKFFSIIAHDLKSPFNSIVGFSEILVEQAREKDFSGIEKYADIILKSSGRAMDLLMNLMDWSRSQTGRMEFSPEYFEMVDLTNEIVLLLADAARQKTILLKQDLPSHAPVYADKEMVSTVLRNLISNAIKFTMAGGEVIIRAEEAPGELTISITDTGVGIPKSSFPKLFRIDENLITRGTNNEHGTGLGLILCKEFIEKHQGRIWAESIEGKGSTFYFSVPYQGSH